MPTLDKNTSMQQLNSDFPGARRALFAKYHIGGCSSCAYEDTDTIESVAKKNEFNLDEAIQHILESHRHDAEMILTAHEAADKIKAGAKLIDIRTREEHEAVKIPGSLFFTQELQQEMFGIWNSDTVIILYDHLGNKALDNCAWIRGHDIINCFIIKGGIDEWSQKIDNSLSRYKLELE